MTSRAIKTPLCYSKCVRYFRTTPPKLTTALPKLEFESLHTPVMVNEVIKMLYVKPGSVILDMTFGGGGHSSALLNSVPNLRIFALDRDPVAHKQAQILAEQHPGQVFPLLGKFSDLIDLLKPFSLHENCFDGILIDIGCSAMQLNDPSRGFTSKSDGPLDMRMDGLGDSSQPTAADVLAHAEEKHLFKIFKLYGRGKKTKKICRAFMETRYTFTPLQTTHQLYNFLQTVCLNDASEIKPRALQEVVRVFQGLRMFVNNEVNELNFALLIANQLLKPDCRIVSLTYNTVEDTIVKRHLQGNTVDNCANPLPLQMYSRMSVIDQSLMRGELSKAWTIINQHVITANKEEQQQNFRSKNARLRAAFKNELESPE